MYGEEERCIQGFGWETGGKEATWETGVDGRIILKRIYEKLDGAWTGLIWLRIKTLGGSCECGNEPSGSVKCRKFLELLRTG